MADNIKVLVDKEMEAIRQKSKLPITMLVGEYVVKNRKTMAQVCLLVSVPVIVYLSSQASQSMRQSSRIFDEQVFVSRSLFGLHTCAQVEDLNYEKRKTDGLLQQLLPVDIIAQLKAGEQPPPKYFLFYCLLPTLLGNLCGNQMFNNPFTELKLSSVSHH